MFKNLWSNTHMHTSPPPPCPQRPRSSWMAFPVCEDLLNICIDTLQKSCFREICIHGAHGWFFSFLICFCKKIFIVLIAAATLQHHYTGPEPSGLEKYSKQKRRFSPSPSPLLYPFENMILLIKYQSVWKCTLYVFMHFLSIWCIKLCKRAYLNGNILIFLR